MARISQQTKDGLIVAVTLGVGLATGFFVDARGKHESTLLPLSALLVLGVTQVVLSFLPSQDMADLEEYRKAEMANLKIRNAMSAQAVRLAEQGKLSEAVDWQNALADLNAGRRKK